MVFESLAAPLQLVSCRSTGLSSWPKRVKGAGRTGRVTGIPKVMRNCHLSSREITGLQAAEFRKQLPPSARRSASVCPMMSINTETTLQGWEALREMTLQTEAGGRLQAAAEVRAGGGGEAHTDAKLRLFGAEEADVRVVLYRDTAAWCPYCQKVWIFLEEKQIPYRVEKVPLRPYGEKPAWFLQKVPSGMLPVMEIDGRMVTESLDIMMILEKAFPEARAMIPGGDRRAEELLRLERELFSAWLGLVFRPGMLGLMGRGTKIFLQAVDDTERELQAAAGPWFLAGPDPTLVDIQFVSFLERMNASCLYWRGIQIRGAEGASRWPGINRWFDAWEQRPSYLATKGDYYSHVQDLPPQVGNPQEEKSAVVREAQAAISGAGGSWALPVHPNDFEPMVGYQNIDEADARAEAAWKLAGNPEAVARFCCRGVGEPGARFAAPLANPLAVPAEEQLPGVHALLRLVVTALLHGYDTLPVKELAAAVVDGPEVKDSKFELVRCMGYLRDRVGVPRDMGYPAAMQLRAHLNWVIDML